MIIRELLTRFGIDYENTGFKKADRAVNTLKSRMTAMNAAATTAFGSLTRLFAGFAGIYGAKRLIEMGSAANETLNVLNEVFKQNSKSVQEWAHAFARDVGRSEYEMRELAGTIGSVVNPLMDGNTEATTEMSKNLAQLAVDLGSFYNVADTDVLIALRAAISGEAEPMKRFGVVMLDATLQAYALEKGIHKKYKTMSIAEKTALRYNFMLDKTRQAQGDAKRTSDGYANAIKGVTGALKDMAIGIMNRVMPAIARFTSYARDKIVPVIENIINKSNILEAALIVLGARMLIAWAPTLIPMLAMLAVLGAIVLLVDEFITMFGGGRTVIGRKIDEAFGKGSTQQIVDHVNEGWKLLIEEVGRADDKLKDFSDRVKEAWDNFHFFSKEWYEGVDIIKDSKITDKDNFILTTLKGDLQAIINLIDWLKKDWQDLTGWIAGKKKSFFEWFEDFYGAKPGSEKRVGEIYRTFLRFLPGGSQVLEPGEQPFVITKEALEELRRREREGRAASRGLGARKLKGPSFGRANAEELPAEEDIPWSIDPTMKGPIIDKSKTTSVNQDINVTNHLTVPEGSSSDQVSAKIGREVLKAVTQHPKDIVSALRQGS